MNPNSYSAGQGYYSPSSYAPAAGAGGHGYPGSMSPYGGGPPMSPYNGGQGQSPTQQQQSIYANQNSQFTGGGGQSPGAGGYPPYPPHQSMQNYYNNGSPTHSVHYPFGPGQIRPGGHEPPRLPAPHPMGLNMMGGARIPHPIHSPNQNVTGNNQIKTENVDLKVGGGPHYPPTQGYNQSAFGFNGYGGGTGNGGGPRPILSPMSPHGRTNISPSNLSPRDGPPNMSPHPTNLYSNQQSSPGNNAISTIASQASTFPHQPPFTTGGYEYFNKQQPPVTQMQPSPLAVGGGYHNKDETAGASSFPPTTTDDKLSDAQSNASEPSFNADNNDVNNLVKKEVISSEHSGDITHNTSNNKQPGDADQPPSIKQELDGDVKVKTEKLEGFNYEDGKEGNAGGYGGNSTAGGMMEGGHAAAMNLDSIPELPDIPDLKYEDIGAMNRQKEQLVIRPKDPSSL